MTQARREKEETMEMYGPRLSGVRVSMFHYGKYSKSNFSVSFVFQTAYSKL